MRYVVTGSAGFVGSHVCEALLERGHEVDGADAFTDFYDPSIKRANAARLGGHDCFRGVELDLARADLDDVLTGADAVIHLAAQPGVRLSWSDGFAVYVERNITASQRLLEAARRTRVPRLVLASSSVYGNATEQPITEGASTRPFSPYGVTKLVMEHLASASGANWGPLHGGPALLHRLRAGLAARHGAPPVHRCGGWRTAADGVRRW
jgi:UDP-glucuronate 4-epimerase